jgi:hypothetical protein
MTAKIIAFHVMFYDYPKINGFHACVNLIFMKEPCRFSRVNT